MWQYYLIMALSVLSVVIGINNKNKPKVTTKLSTGQSILMLVIGGLMTWLMWSFLSVNWMWLSIGLMAISFINLGRMLLCVMAGKISPEHDYGFVLAICYGIAYTVFYIQYV